MKIAYRASVTEIDALAATIREADRLELWRAAAQTPFDGIFSSIQKSSRVFVVYGGGELLSIGGLVFGNDLNNMPWAITSKAVDRHKRDFHRAGLQVLEMMKNFSVTLTNFVDAENTRSIEWLRGIGFELTGDVEFFGPESHPFLMFTAKGVL